MQRAFLSFLHELGKLFHDQKHRRSHQLIALQKRYYQRFKGYTGYYRLKRHVTKLKGMARFAYWKQLDAQAIQHIVWRIDHGYQKFFRQENRGPPTFRKRSRHRSSRCPRRAVAMKAVTVCGCSDACIGFTTPGRSQASSRP